MLRRLIPLIIFLLGVGVSYAQTSTPAPAEKWWWAWRDSTHELIAFNAEGNTHVIARADYFVSLARINADTAIAVLQTGNTDTLDKVTSESAVTLMTPINAAAARASMSPFYPLAVQWPYAVISTLNETPAIINFDDDTIAPLDRTLIMDNCPSIMGSPPPQAGNCLRFSADGRYLRYIAVPSASEPQALLDLRERDLASGSERTFYSAPDLPGTQNDVVHCEAGEAGEYWLCERYSDYPDYQLHADWLVDSKGQTRTLIEETLFPTTWNIFLSGSDLFVQDMCLQTCAIDVYRQDGNHLQRFNVTSVSINYGSVFATLLANGNLYLEGGIFQAFTLTPAGHLQELGNVYCCEYIDTKSPDLHWVVLATDNHNTATVWDLQTDQVKFVIPTSIDPAIIYTDNGFIIRSLDADANHAVDNWVYFNDVDKFLEIPLDAGIFVNILPDDSLLYQQFTGNQDLKAGIYRYDPVTKTYTLLVPNGEFLPDY